MAADTPLAVQSGNNDQVAEAPSFLAPVEKPKGLMLRIIYWYARRQWGKVPRPFSVFCARMPSAFGGFFGKVSKLDKKLAVSSETAVVVRQQVASTNTCTWCMDGQRWFAIHKAPQHLAKLDALHSGIDPDSTSPVTPSQSWQTQALDGEVYGQPLTYGSYVYVATENDTI
jgi:hypothetical protein